MPVPPDEILTNFLKPLLVAVAINLVAFLAFVVILTLNPKPYDNTNKWRQWRKQHLKLRQVLFAAIAVISLGIVLAPMVAVIQIRPP